MPKKEGWQLLILSWYNEEKFVHQDLIVQSITCISEIIVRGILCGLHRREWSLIVLWGEDQGIIQWETYTKVEVVGHRHEQFLIQINTITDELTMVKLKAYGPNQKDNKRSHSWREVIVSRHNYSQSEVHVVNSRWYLLRIILTKLHQYF